MEDPISTDNPNVMVSNNPQGTQTVTSGTGEPNGQAQGATPSGTDDLFKGIDPNKLPPESKASYDSMLKDYRSKTAKLKETIKSEVEKALQPHRQKAELYDNLIQQEEFVNMWNEHVKKVNSAVNANPNDPTAKLEEKLQTVSQEFEQFKLNQIAEAFAESVNEKGEKLHPDFDKFNGISIGQLGDGESAQEYSYLRAFIELAPGRTPEERLTNGYAKAKEVYNAIFEEGKKAGLGRMQSKIQNSTQPPTNAGGPTTSMTDKRPKNAREALEMARRGIEVSR